MANTPNLDLEEVNSSDIIGTTFVNKINNNNTKLDTAYGHLKENLLDLTGETDLESAINDYQNGFHNAVERFETTGDATANDIRAGKTALVQGTTIIGAITINDCYVSTLEPTSADGNNGDLWLVVEV